MDLTALQPEKVFYYFGEIAKIPHGSRNTKAISDYLVAFAKERGLACSRDRCNNVIIWQEGTPGYEHAAPVILQGHMDMVCEKEPDCAIDFEREGLSLYVEGDFLRAQGTTLGGDDGIALAYALAILDDKNIPHPPLEVVFTVDEEIGMLGAYDIDLSALKGRRLLNLDSDVEGHFLTSCAGGLSVCSRIPISRTKQKGLLAELSVCGLSGGHSGSEIDKEHGNANILMGRVLKGIYEITPFGILDMAGGLKDNAIPRECHATLLLPEENKQGVLEILENLDAVFKKEFFVSDPQVSVEVRFSGVKEGDILDFSSVNKLIFFLRTTPNGVLHMSRVMEGLVETSLNLGILKLTEDCLTTVTSIRSSVSSRKEDVRERLTDLVEMLGGEVSVEGDYPAWEYRKDSPLRQQIGTVYEELFGEPPVFEAIHAGLECGIFSDKIPDLDCVSFGPTNLDIHTPIERLSISSVNRVWQLLLEFLRRAA